MKEFEQIYSHTALSNGYLIRYGIFCFMWKCTVQGWKSKLWTDSENPTWTSIILPIVYLHMLSNCIQSFITFVNIQNYKMLTYLIEYHIIIHLHMLSMQTTKCTTKPLSKHLTSILTAVKDHLQFAWVGLNGSHGYLLSRSL